MPQINKIAHIFKAERHSQVECALRPHVKKRVKVYLTLTRINGLLVAWSFEICAVTAAGGRGVSITKLSSSNKTGWRADAVAAAKSLVNNSTMEDDAEV